MLKRTTPLKKSGSLKRSKLKAKPRTEEQKEIDRLTRDADRRFCEELWRTRGPRSEVSGTYLGSEPNWACVHHLVSKAKYPVYRYDSDNVILLTLQEHADTENGNPSEIVRKRTEQVKQKYGL